MKIPKEVRQDRLPVGNDSSNGDSELDDLGMVVSQKYILGRWFDSTIRHMN